MNESANYLVDRLAAEGFPACLDSDGDVTFKCEGMHYFLCFDEGDPSFGKLILPNVWEIESPAELQQALAALDNINRKMKVAKGYTQRDQVCFTVELWLDTQARWSDFLQRAVRALTHSLGLFMLQMRGDETPPERTTLTLCN